MKFMGIDVGTTGVKAAVFNENGAMLGYGFQGYGILFGEGKQAEQDAEAVWACTRKVMAQAAAQAGGDIAAIGLSTQGDAVIPIDREGNALHPAILGMDYRTQPEAEACARMIGDRYLFEKTGMRSHPMNSLMKIMWFQEHFGDFSGKLWKYTTYADFLLLKLGAEEPVIDLSMASRVMALDLETKAWDTGILQAVGIDIETLSKPVPSGVVVGALKNTVAEETGIRERAKVVTGGHDQPCAALGAGIVGEGTALDSHGTAEVLSTAFQERRTNDRMYSSFYPVTYHVVPDRFFTFALNHTGGILLQWVRDTLCGEDVQKARELEMDPYTYLIEQAPELPSQVMVLPHFNGSGTPWCDMKSKGAFLGLSMDTTRGDLVKGTLDSLTYEMRINLERFQESHIPVERIRCVGGAAKSRKWLKLKADILGCTVETLKVREAACLGAAMLAASAFGMYTSPLDALPMVRIQERFEPDGDRRAEYEEKYRVYAGIYETLKKVNHAM